MEDSDKYFNKFDPFLISCSFRVNASLPGPALLRMFTEHEQGLVWNRFPRNQIPVNVSNFHSDINPIPFKSSLMQSDILPIIIVTSRARHERRDPQFIQSTPEPIPVASVKNEIKPYKHSQLDEKRPVHPSLGERDP
ncbi:hypothetical protein I7I51_08962 [Histoplasma capsulatum]|uniref:Uncharacterized protein n=1 Tax=Ajellomyces capsulatus TaxID=5037 RepID=A0A8A1M5Q9_AJECA|nr:hypothetical protein I7I51_08962 [Histoplasma capsulatum]